MKEIKVVATCDKCGGPDADEYTELNSRGKEVVLDLDKPCRDWREELHRKATLILAPVVTLADEKGVEPEKVSAKAAQKPSSKKSGERVCLMCPETKGSDTGIRDHMHNEHGWPKSMPDIFGNFCPIDGGEYPRVAQHIAQSHKEFPNATQAFAHAKANGDPHGVVAERIAVLEEAAHAAA